MHHFFIQNETYQILYRGDIRFYHLGIFWSGFKTFTPLSFFGYFILPSLSLCDFNAHYQFRIQKKQPVLDFVEVEKLEDNDRGGIGSTGVK